MKAVPRISETEWEIMRVVWEHHPLTAAEVVERLAKRDPSWHPKTARTLLGRLVRKRAVRYEAQGRAYVYEPGMAESDCVAAESESFLERVFGGSLRPMLVHFAERQKLTREDLKELNDLLEEQTKPTKRR